MGAEVFFTALFLLTDVFTVIAMIGVMRISRYMMTAFWHDDRVLGETVARCGEHECH